MFDMWWFASGVLIGIVIGILIGIMFVIISLEKYDIFMKYFERIRYD
jgi:hypothetical protein